MPRFVKTLFLFCLQTLPFRLVAMLAFLSGCQTEVPIPPLPETPPKLVLYALVSPETEGFQLSVTSTTLLQASNSTPQPTVVPDATVLLTDLQDTVLVPYDPVEQLYILPHFTVKPGREYRLLVTAPGGLSATAACTVPAKINRSLNPVIDSTSVAANTSGKSYVLEMNWQDLPGSGDFYRVDAKMVNRNAVEPTQGIQMPEMPLTRDQPVDGRKWQRRSDVFPFEEDPGKPVEKPDSVYAYLLTTDQPYYDFHISLYNQRNSLIGLGSLSDPVSVYTNVQGGFGLFAAYRSYRVGVNL